MLLQNLSKIVLISFYLMTVYIFTFLGRFRTEPFILNIYIISRGLIFEGKEICVTEQGGSFSRWLIFKGLNLLHEIKAEWFEIWSLIKCASIFH